MVDLLECFLNFILQNQIVYDILHSLRCTVIGMYGLKIEKWHFQLHQKDRSGNYIGFTSCRRADRKLIQFRWELQHRPRLCSLTEGIGP